MKIIETIHIMNNYSKHIGYRAELIVDFIEGNFGEKTPKNTTLLNSILSMIIIDSISYIDEYHEVFGNKTEKIFKERVRIIKLINKPFLSEINKWKDLRDFRNQFIAHNLKVKKNGESILQKTELDYNAPRNLYDLLFLSNLIQFLTQNINSEFQPELKEESKITKPLITHKNRISNKEEVSLKTIEILKQSDKLKEKYNRKYIFTFEKLI